MPPHRHAYRPTIMGTRGAIASAHPLASMAGMQILLQGGNAIDAAVAVASSLNVVEPYMSGIGGIGVMLIYSAKHNRRYVLDFVGCTPQAADPERVTFADIAQGPKSCVTPGNLGGWLAALDKFGSMPRQVVFAPAIRLASDGFPLTWKNLEFFEIARAGLAQSPEAQRVFVGEGRQVGDLLVQQELARTYRIVAEGGAEAFYHGPLAKAMACAMREAGGWLSETDLAAFKPEWKEPVSIHYKGYEVFTSPPPLVSFQLLETLNILSGDDLAGWGHNSAEYLHHLIEAIKLSVADRLAYAYTQPLPLQGLLSKAYAAAQRQRIDPRQAAISEGERFNPEKLPGQLREGHPADFMKEHTTHFACADSDGNVVTCTQTLGSLFEGFMVPGTGIMLNNMLQWMDLHPDNPYRLKPGRKPSNNMSPAQVARDGRFYISIGTPGSYGIMQTTAQMILNLLEFGMTMQEAIEAPRIRVYRDRKVEVEGRISEAVRAELTQRGHQVVTPADWTWAVGGGQGILRDPQTGAWHAGADPRRDGYALAW